MKARLLGEGRTSLVVSISWTDWYPVLQTKTGALPTSVIGGDAQGRVALRVCKMHDHVPVQEPTVRRVLQRYLGWQVDVALTDRLRDAIVDGLTIDEADTTTTTCDDDTHRVLMERLTSIVRNSTHAVLVPDFTEPLATPQDNDQDCVVNTYEIKPKGVWTRPTTVAARLMCPSASSASQQHQTQDIEAHVHALKRMQCRFSLMQYWKAHRSAKGGKPEKDTLMNNGGSPEKLRMSSYCPNDFFLASSPESILRALDALSVNPQNNLRTLGVGTSTSCRILMPALHKRIVSSFLFAMEDLRSRIVSLQRGMDHVQVPAQCVGNQQLEVLDTSILSAWSSASNGLQRTSRNQLMLARLLQDSDARGHVSEVTCGCRLGSEEWSERLSRLSSSSSVAWTLCDATLDDMMDAFYVSTTAKDLSLLVTVQCDAALVSHDDYVVEKVCVDDDVSSATTQSSGVTGVVWLRALEKEASSSTNVPVFCRVAVIDIDCKRHKPLSHYCTQDLDICAAAAAHLMPR